LDVAPRDAQRRRQPLESKQGLWSIQALPETPSGFGR